MACDKTDMFWNDSFQLFIIWQLLKQSNAGMFRKCLVSVGYYCCVTKSVKPYGKQCEHSLYEAHFHFWKSLVKKQVYQVFNQYFVVLV